MSCRVHSFPVESWLLRTPKVSSPSVVVIDLERALGESLKRGGMSIS
jgi:hypothetical protein